MTGKAQASRGECIRPHAPPGLPSVWASLGVGAVIATGWLVGAACGGGTKTAPLAPAGDRLDDGTGIVARGWRQALRGDEDSADNVQPLTDPLDVYDEYDDFYEYDELLPLAMLANLGGSQVGGTLYGGYVFDLGGNQDETRPEYSTYEGSIVDKGGTITGRVSFSGGRTAAPVARPRAGCNASKPAQRSAVVYLKAIERGKRGLATDGYLRAQVGGTIAVGACSATPQLQLVAPIGGTVRIHNDSTEAQNLAVEHLGGGPPAKNVISDLGDHRPPGETPSTSRSAAAAGEVESAKTTMTIGPHALRSYTVLRGGIHQVSIDDSPFAYFIAQYHPYFALTDPNGDFQLTDIPAGRYTLITFAPPPMAAGSAWGGDTTHMQTIVVKPGRTTPITITVR